MATKKPLLAQPLQLYKAGEIMAMRLSQPENINVLISKADWAWPQAVAEIFQPRRINAMLTDSVSDMVRLITHNKMHLAILDSPPDDLSGMQALKIIRQHDQLLPCILLAVQPGRRLLAEALTLNAFSVMAKPVDLALLAEQVDRLFLKYYDINGN
jgi:DNA-binding NtrC family response regulator